MDHVRDWKSVSPTPINMYHSHLCTCMKGKNCLSFQNQKAKPSRRKGGADWRWDRGLVTTWLSVVCCEFTQAIITLTGQQRGTVRPSHFWFMITPAVSSSLFVNHETDKHHITIQRQRPICFRWLVYTYMCIPSGLLHVHVHKEFVLQSRLSQLWLLIMTWCADFDCCGIIRGSG